MKTKEEIIKQYKEIEHSLADILYGAGSICKNYMAFDFYPAVLSLALEEKRFTEAERIADRLLMIMESLAVGRFQHGSIYVLRDIYKDIKKINNNIER